MERSAIENALYEVTQSLKYLELLSDKLISIKSDLENLESHLPIKDEEIF